jgi:hypothetical protein
VDAESSSDSKPAAPSPDAVFAALQRILADDGLRLSERNRRFLSFVVSEFLAGRGDRIKAYSIGVDVFGRPESFDPGSDPIVRIEATRIRAALSSYYDNAGAGESVRISLPPGGYAPTFEWSPSPGQLCNTLENSHGSRIFALRTYSIFINHHWDAHDRFGRICAELLADSIVARLRTLGFRILVAAEERRSGANSIKSLLGKSMLSCALEVVVHTLSDARRYSWRLIGLESGQIMVSELVDRLDKGVPGAEMIDDLADRAVKTVTAAILRMDGVMTKRNAASERGCFGG